MDFIAAMSDAEIFALACVALIVFRVAYYGAVESGAPGIIGAVGSLVSFVIAITYAVKLITTYL